MLMAPVKWNLDILGNWKSVWNDANGNGSFEATGAEREHRDGDGTFSGDPDDNFFYLTDVMFSVRAVVDGTGLLHTRLDYTPYGVAMHGKAADVNGDGALTFADIGIASQNYNAGTPLQPGQTNYDPDADLLGAGADYSLFLSRYTAYSSGPSFNDGWIDNPNDDVNGPDNSVGYDGYWFDLAGATEATSTGLYMVRFRVYDPKLGRWLQRDPLGYIDGTNCYLAVRGNPTAYTDPTGAITNIFRKLLNFFTGSAADNCTEWVFSRARNNWRQTKVEVAVEQPITLPATTLIDIILTLNDAAGGDGPSLTTWGPMKFSHNDPELFDIWNGVRNGSRYTRCRCHWARDIIEKRTCCDSDGNSSPQTRSRQKKAITYDVLNIVFQNEPFCHCPVPD